MKETKLDEFCIVRFKCQNLVQKNANVLSRLFDLLLGFQIVGNHCSNGLLKTFLTILSDFFLQFVTFWGGSTVAHLSA